ncbi:hypothetical protein LTR36_006792 [Oleoguttula mirabilis]|uniref:Uncharacterized protein n=1 Tax=Oleoguttula mirabilis TaxID=1507867 RepID=A0AAV9JB88_9PEZI|nr:hypothetical protein LTR36_006792 [Oleoguttula mirabilis]
MPPASFSFYDETPEVRAMYNVGTLEESNQPNNTSPPLFGESNLANDPSPPFFPAASSVTSTQLADDHAYPVYLSPPSDAAPNTSSGPLSSQWESSRPFTYSEARLVRNFVDKMALWCDATDPVRTFEVEVPCRALREPILRHAICAFSARHFYRGERGEVGEAEALHHQNKCLELLIPAMSGCQSITESTLTAVAMLRQNEEMDGQYTLAIRPNPDDDPGDLQDIVSLAFVVTDANIPTEHDNRFHLTGISGILNMVPDFAAAGGLGEAAAWLCLREDIYVSLTSQTCVNIRLEKFQDAVAILRADDYTWANKMVLNLATLLNRAFSECSSREDLLASEAEIEDWDQRKPATYRPIHVMPKSHREGRRFPEVWMLAPHHAVGLQYYHIAQIILNVMKQQQQQASKPYEHLHETRLRERQIRHHLLVIVGLAVSNSRAENTLFTARHCLSVWAGCLRKQADQLGALEFLDEMGRRTGWKTTMLVQSLRRQWEEDSASE